MLYLKFIDWLKESGIEKLHIGKTKLKKDFNPFQNLLIEILVKDKSIKFKETYGRPFYEENEIILLRGKGDMKTNAVVIRGKGLKPEIEIPKYPKFLIDLSFFYRHTPKEKRRLIKQIVFSLREIRKYLIDQNLVLTGLENYTNIEKFLGKNKILKFKNLNEFLKAFEPKKVLILDPYSERELKGREIREADAFLIGGIVDLGSELKGETRRLFKDFDFERRSIKLEGSIKGVPDRINRIISILLKVRFKNYNLKEAIISEQTRKDILTRLQVELPRVWIKKGNKFYIKEEDLEKLSKTLFGGKDLRKYVKIFKIDILP